MFFHELRQISSVREAVLFELAEAVFVTLSLKFYSFVKTTFIRNNLPCYCSDNHASVSREITIPITFIANGALFRQGLALGFAIYLKARIPLRFTGRQKIR